MMEVMMAMKKMMMAVRLMVDFGPFLEDSATRKCGLKDHAVHFGSVIDTRAFSCDKFSVITFSF